MGQEAADKSAGSGFPLILNIEVAEDREYESPDKIDEEIVHGIDQADIQISTKTKVLAINRDFLNIGNRNGDVLAVRVQRDRSNRVDNRIFLHIQMEQCIHGEFEQLPDSPDCH